MKYRYYFNLIDINDEPHLIEASRLDVSNNHFSHTYESGLPLNEPEAAFIVAGRLVLMGSHSAVAGADEAFDNAGLGMDAYIITQVRLTNAGNRHDPQVNDAVHVRSNQPA